MHKIDRDVADILHVPLFTVDVAARSNASSLIILHLTIGEIDQVFSCSYIQPQAHPDASHVSNVGVVVEQNNCL